MKITKRQLRKIIREEKAKLNERMDPSFGIFSEDFMYDLLVDEVENYLRERADGPSGLTRTEIDSLRAALMGALQNLVEDYS